MESTPPATPTLQLWVDATAGVAGDMLLAALIDAGADLDVVRGAVAAVVPDEVVLVGSTESRAGLRARRLTVRLARSAPHAERTWRSVHQLLQRAELSVRVRRDALAVFAALAAVEARVHDVALDDVHFHEVGAWDSIADVVGVCAALDDLSVGDIRCSAVALGHGAVDAAHGSLPIPVPAVLELIRVAGLPVGPAPATPGEAATPTGVAVLAALATGHGPMPPGVVVAVGVGAGARDTPDRPNITRVVLTEDAPGQAPATTEHLRVLECTVDDLDPRVWPVVLADLIHLGVNDAWLTPVLMKKGRPGHVLTILVVPELADGIQEWLFRHTSTLGVRSHDVTRSALVRGHVQVDIPGGCVRVKLGRLHGKVVSATPEFEDCLALARSRGVPVADVLADATAAVRRLEAVRKR
ncbi:MAG: nickel pincer cofactor biosynthesis protein LarC [Ornithinimicrobium sp.]|uniref:nickel pincer cofactor biosynthesis protein LarC n=1 Tax=Ornithinimicrobium sp. TaxID=1977084 RepID=UPI003D9BC678